MAGKHYSDQFRRQAVDLYESTPAATLRGIAADLGVERATVMRWVRELGSGTKTGADGGRVDRSAQGKAPATTNQAAACSEKPTESDQERIARLEADNAALRAETTKLETERAILRQAAKYFAGETNW